MTPIEMQILLNYYWSNDPDNSFNSSITTKAAIVATDSLVRMGLLKRDKDPGTHTRYKLTLKGNAHVTALKNLPLPEQVWVTPEAEEQAHS